MQTVQQKTTAFWIFGYGSLIWKPNFRFICQKPAILTGWSRRFYQGSPDHRGTDSHPGRVVTLLPNPSKKCYGMAYQIASTDQDETLQYLDFREQKGYSLLTENIHFFDDTQTPALVYIASSQNPHFLGPAAAKDIANQIIKSIGPSGSNLEYFIKLRSALQQFAPPEEHIEEIFTHLAE